ncbi:hypothetical protein PRECH8_04950 [Insulibacter thermoxylanivorax]|uniref:Uncharacterized protein n=1 Tax=Insulibacter thermoxylanivorax TaxID=2749268 RepID=A0A916QCU3_9BACL|nr:hypothetical protein [Insulibacter thermoxylanivorax]GFR37199.1 hypothetical protein PRECH8_04950 [Insulibacter thermoxylanivorax]
MDTKDRNKLLLKLMLVLVRDRQAMQGRIRSVGYTREYGQLPPDLGVYTLGQLEVEEIVSLAESIGVRSILPLGAKSEIYLNDVGYALYNFAKDSPMLIDGLTRAGAVKVCREAGIGIEELDQMIAEYWRLREQGRIGESAANSDQASPFRGYRHLLQPLLIYYMFNGSEHGESLFPAECVIAYEDPLNTNTWTVYEPEETIDVIWDQLVFSVREGTRDTAERGEETGEAAAEAERLWAGGGAASGLKHPALYVWVKS